MLGMQCQSCGLEVRKNSKTCPSCGEAVVTVPTSLITSQGNTTSLDNSFLKELSPVTASAGANIKVNGKPASNELLGSFVVNSMMNTEKAAFTKEATPPTEVLSSEMFCRRCHNELKTGAKFCSVCGTTSGPTKIEQVAKSLQLFAGDGVKVIRTSLKQTNLPALTIGALLLGAFCLLAAVFQYLIPISAGTIDASSLSPLIYHLRSIQFLLMALIFVVTGLIFNRR